MELLIVLGLCFGAYELLGVFQGCFQYNEHPFPYQPSQNFESQKQTDEQEEKQQSSDDEQSQQQQHQKNCESGTCETEFVEENLDSIKSENCSCYSIEDVFDDDKRTILKNSKRKKSVSGESSTSAGKSFIISNHKNFNFDKTVNKLKLSSSLMSLNRNDSSIFQLYSKFNDESDEISIASVHKSRRNNKLVNNKSYSKSTTSLNNDVNYSYSSSNYNETSSEIHSTMNNVDINNKKIFFISSTAT